MMLVHKQPPLPQQFQPAVHHRRHPSAPPTLIVQPTRTPGLLSLSKPLPKASPQRQPNPAQRKSPRPRQALLNAAEITDKKTAVHPRKQAKPSETAKQTPARPGKHRQPSPDPSQAEASDSSQDPFLDLYKPRKPHMFQTSPKAIPAAHRSPKAIPAAHRSTKAIPAAHRSTKSQQLSRSEPAVSHSWDHICDDSNDESPSTPLRANSSGPVPETPKRKFRNHKRAPSDHIFAMSSDDEAASGAEDLRALLNFVRSGSRPSSTSTPPPHRMPKPDLRTLSPASREKYFEREAQKEVAGYFASSSFQNSPSPDDLPDPQFA